MSNPPPDPYKVLGVSKNAQLPDIRAAHRKLVLKCHPDKVHDPTLKAQKQDEFQSVQQAYELLSNEEERKRYDKQVHEKELHDTLRAQTKTAHSSPTSKYDKYEFRASERPRTNKPTTPKSYHSRSREDDPEWAQQIFEEPRSSKKESSYNEKSSKRSKDKDRDYTRERQREREYNETPVRGEERGHSRGRSEKNPDKFEKRARDWEREQQKKRKSEEKKRDSEEKKRHANSYDESFDDEPVYKEKKKSSKKHGEKRERSSHREEVPPTTTSIPPPPMPQVYGSNNMEGTLDSAISYIQASRTKPQPPHRAATYDVRHVQPPAPTPPLGHNSTFSDDDAHRSSAKPRRGSSGDKAYKKPSKEVLEDPVDPVSHRTRMPKTPFASPATGSPPRREVPRTNTIPVEGYPRPTPNISRAQTFNGAYPEVSDPRGRNRSKMSSQVPVDYNSNEDYAPKQREYERELEREREWARDRARDSKHRSKKHRSPQRNAEHFMQYKVSEGRAMPMPMPTSYSREPQMETFGYYPSGTHGVHVKETRPSMPFYSRSGSYSAKYPEFTTTRKYNYTDAKYSAYPVEGVY